MWITLDCFTRYSPESLLIDFIPAFSNYKK